MKYSFIFLGIFLLTVPFLLSCQEANNIAPGGASLFLSADPQQIGTNGTSVLTVTGTGENGAPLPDGTRVSFAVDLAGSVSPNSVRLLNGTATGTYHATFVTGDVMITATSGSVEANTTITVSDSLDENVFVSANPATFPAGGGTSRISAVVTDGSGQPIEGIGVQFSTTQGTLQSGGDSIETDSHGVATDTLLLTTESASVTATTEKGSSGQTTVTVGVVRIVCHMSVSTTTPGVGQMVSFFDTTEDPDKQIVRYHWDFGDATSADAKNVQHAYSNSGTFNVVHSVIDSSGNTSFCDPIALQVSR